MNGAVIVRLVISFGVQTDDIYRESLRCSVDVEEDAKVADVLEEVKQKCVPLVPALNNEPIKRHLYLIHDDTMERLDNDKSVKDYALVDGSIIRLRSGVR
ncbi:MAG: hypothetical protein ACFE7R_10035 [Candidatus Hodarchaeota archaeon]